MSFAVSFLSSDCLLVGRGANEGVATFEPFHPLLDWFGVSRELMDGYVL